jgi:hypothetical protein
MNSLLSGFSGGTVSVGLHTQEQTMFVFNRSALAVLAPIALLIAVVLWSNWSDSATGSAPTVVVAERAPAGHAAASGTLTASNNRDTPAR